MGEINKSDVIDFAASIRKLVDALVNEGFDEDRAFDLVEKIIVNSQIKNTKF